MGAGLQHEEVPGVNHDKQYENICWPSNYLKSLKER
jgi:hypothetical protein